MKKFRNIIAYLGAFLFIFGGIAFIVSILLGFFISEFKLSDYKLLLISIVIVSIYINKRYFIPPCS